MADLTLTLLGGFEATRTTGALLSLPTKKAQALLVYCALRPGRAQQREHLATLLWAETAQAQARNSLRQTLFVLRTALRGKLSTALRIEASTVATDPAVVEADVLRFEGLVAERSPQALEQAAALYRGDLLEGFVVDSEPFEQWLFQERERLRDMATEVLARLLRHQTGEGRTEAAIQTARRLLSLDPLQEAVHRVVMRLHAQAGRRQAAVRQYETCLRVLRRELGLEPETDTQRLYEQIVGMDRAASRANGDAGRPPTRLLEDDALPTATSQDRHRWTLEARQERELARQLRARTRQLVLDNAREVAISRRLLADSAGLPDVMPGREGESSSSSWSGATPAPGAEISAPVGPSSVRPRPLLSVGRGVQEPVAQLALDDHLPEP
jgi:DNA-binding SARP family transcriptional activator